MTDKTIDRELDLLLNQDIITEFMKIGQEMGENEALCKTALYLTAKLRKTQNEPFTRSERKALKQVSNTAFFKTVNDIFNQAYRENYYFPNL